jgi:membrane protease YdiL (CAAX protease family)
MSTAVPSDPPGLKFGPWQAVWLVLGYVGAQYAGSFLVYFGWGLRAGTRGALHSGKLAGSEPDVQVLAWSVLLGMLLGIAWVLYYLSLRAKPLFTRGDIRGLGWCAPSEPAYVNAALVALAALAFAVIAALAIPPDLHKLGGPLSRLMLAPGLPRTTVLILGVVVAPVIEELTFRGAMFAALLRRFSVATAGAVTTLTFVAGHAPDKIHYWPGFIIVGVLGVMLLGLRIRYRSLWPGMLAHFLYNSVSLLLI